MALTRTLVAVCLAAGFARAEDRAARAYEAGRFDVARTEWLARAHAGDAGAALQLGLLYDLGRGVRRSPGTAFRWYLAAAEGGLPDAEFNVAAMLDGGIGVALDERAAALWYARAASHGNERAAFDLGQMYAAGQGVPRNPALAAQWFTAAKDVPEAARRLAELSQASGTPAPGSRLAPPEPQGGSGRGATRELVWNAPAEPVPVRYFVSVVKIGAAPSRVGGGFADRSAMLVELPGPGRYAWRVFAVSADSRHYAASGWHLL